MMEQGERDKFLTLSHHKQTNLIKNRNGSKINVTLVKRKIRNHLMIQTLQPLPPPTMCQLTPPVRSTGWTRLTLIIRRAG